MNNFSKYHNGIKKTNSALLNAKDHKVYNHLKDNITSVSYQISGLIFTSDAYFTHIRNCETFICAKTWLKKDKNYFQYFIDNHLKEIVNKYQDFNITLISDIHGCNQCGGYCHCSDSEAIDIYTTIDFYQKSIEVYFYYWCWYPELNTKEIEAPFTRFIETHKGINSGGVI